MLGFSPRRRLRPLYYLLFLLALSSARAQTPTLTVLHSFGAYGGRLVNADGVYPYAAPVPGRDGRLYGTTLAGGPAGTGTVYARTASAAPARARRPRA